MNGSLVLWCFVPEVIVLRQGPLVSFVLLSLYFWLLSCNLRVQIGVLLLCYQLTACSVVRLAQDTTHTKIVSD